MSLQMKLDEAQEALGLIGSPAAAAFERALCAIGDAMGEELARLLDCDAGSATQEGKAFAGLCFPLQPRYRDQPFPAGFDYFDDGGRDDWEEQAKAEDLPPMPDDVASRAQALRDLMKANGYDE